MIDEQQKRDYQKSFERTITPKIAIGVSSSVLKTPEQMLYERIELLEYKMETVRLGITNIENILLKKLK